LPTTAAENQEVPSVLSNGVSARKVIVDDEALLLL